MFEGQLLAVTQVFVNRSAYKTPLVEYLGHTSTHLSVVGSTSTGQLDTQDLVESSL